MKHICVPCKYKKHETRGTLVFWEINAFREAFGNFLDPHQSQYQFLTAVAETPPSMSEPQRTHQSFTTTDVLAAVQYPILHHQQCPGSRSALTNPSPPPMFFNNVLPLSSYINLQSYSIIFFLNTYEDGLVVPHICAKLPEI